MMDFEKLFLSWREGLGHSRHIVGVLTADSFGNMTFRYLPDKVLAAKKHGFSCYTEFNDINKVYTENVLEIFGQRLIKPERPDIKDFYSFWEIDPAYKNDKFYLLGHTQGLSPTDNFEFLADYEIVPDLHFLTEIAALSYLKLPANTVKTGDELTIRFENENIHDNSAVKVFKANVHVGYIKKIHCKVFSKKGGDKLKLTVKAVDQNGVLKRVFLKVHL